MTLHAIAWLEDLDEATRRATEEGKLVLAHFFNEQ